MGASPPFLAAGLVQILFSAPAWAEELVTEAAREVQNIDIPSVPSAEEVANKVPEAGGSILDLFADNPVVIVGLGFLAAVPLAISFFSGGSLGVKTVNPSGALEGLSTDPNTVLIDIRNREEIKEQGSPNLASTKKKAILLPFTRVVQGEANPVEDFAEKFGKLKQIKSDTSIIILDATGREAGGAAKVLAKLVGRVYYVKGGAAGWRESGEAWREPGKSLLNLDSLAEDFKSQPTLTKAGVAVGAVGVAAAVLFQEAGTVLELAGIAAAGAFALPNFLGKGDSSGGTLKRQVKDFVQEGEREAQDLGGKVSRKVDEVTDSDLGAEVERGAEKAGSELEKASNSAQAAVEDAARDPEKAARKVGNKAEEAGEQVGDIAEEGAEKVESAAGSARQWIEDWKKEQGTK
jgi:rhodanese-related sulfurtransferase